MKKNEGLPQMRFDGISRKGFFAGAIAEASWGAASAQRAVSETTAMPATTRSSRA